MLRARAPTLFIFIFSQPYLHNDGSYNLETGLRYFGRPILPRKSHCMEKFGAVGLEKSVNLSKSAASLKLIGALRVLGVIMEIL